MATEYATDVEMQSFDFTSFLLESNKQRTLFPGIFSEGPLKPTVVSKSNLGIFGESNPDTHFAALKAAVKQGNHIVLRIPSPDARNPAALVGIFALAGESNGKPFLGIAPITPKTDPNLSPVYRNGGVPVKVKKWNIEDALAEGGDSFFTPAGYEDGSCILVQPLSLLYRNGPTSKENLSVKILSNNLGPIPPVQTAIILEGGNLEAGTYTYTRVPVTSKGEQAQAESETIVVTLTALDVTAGRRSIKLGWDLDDESVRGLQIYRQFVPASGTNPVIASGRVTSLSRSRVVYLDDTFRVEDTEPPSPTTRDIIDNNFTLEVSLDSIIIENLPITFNTETEAYSASPINESVNENSNYLLAERLYTTKLIQDVNGIVCYSTPNVPLAGGFSGTILPTEDDLEDALIPFLNRDRYRISNLVDLGWCTPRAAYEMAKVSEAQRAHTLLPIPRKFQRAQSAVAYAASLTMGSRRNSIYTPWMYSRDEDTGARVLVPASAFAAQAMHQSDRATIGGVGRSFAGLNRGIVDAIGVEDADLYEYDDTERDLMAVGLVNYFRRRPDVGMALWEDWTLQRNLSAASFVSVSRLWDVIQNAISDYLEYKLKEPNDEYNLIEILSGLNEFLKSHVLARNLSGYEVVADSRAGNNDSTADQGIRNIDVYLTPIIPVRRYRCRTILTRQGAKYSDLMQVM